MSKKILFIQFPQHFQEGFLASLEKHNLEGTFIEFKDVTLINNKISYNGVFLEKFDFIFFGLTVKNVDFYLLLLQYVKKYNKPFLVYGSKEASNKKIFEIFKLSDQNIPVIPSIVSTNQNDIKNFVVQYAYPFVSKPIKGARGMDVLQHHNLDSIFEAINNSTIPLIIQPMIPNNGDYRIWILKDKILGVIKRTSTYKNEFRNNISLGGIAEIADLPKNILDICIEAKNIMGLDIAGVDVIEDINTKEYYIMEVNTDPQVGGFISTTGIDVFDKIIEYIKETLK